MSFFDCVSDALDEGSIDKARAERAQEYWRTFRDRHMRNGHSPEAADALAGEDVKAAFRKEFGDDRQRFIATRIAMRKSEALVESADDLAGLAIDRIEFRQNSTNRVSPLSQQAEGLFNRVKGRLTELAESYGPKMLTGKSKNPAGLDNVAREMLGQPTGDARAAMVGKVVADTFEELRRMANEAGANIGKIDNYLPQQHNWLGISKAGFDEWFDAIAPKLAWHRIDDYLTGRPMAAEGSAPPLATQREFLRRIFDERAFGEKSDTPTYGQMTGENIVRSMNGERVLHFKDADSWIEYNKVFGTGDIFSAIMHHVRAMSEDIVTMREFGASWRMGLDYERQVAVAKARAQGDTALAGRIDAGYRTAERMLAIRRGGASPRSVAQAQRASFFSSVRGWTNASLLERAIVPSLSDMNSLRMAAQTMGRNPANILARQLRLVFDSASRKDLQRMNRVMDHTFNANAVTARFNAEVPPKGFIDNINNAVFRYTGLTGWTQLGRHNAKLEWAGALAEFAGRKLDEVDNPIRDMLIQRGVTEDEWAAFSDPDLLFRDEGGVDFLDALYWREATDMDPARADDIFLKFEGIAEEWSEVAIPSRSLYARAKVLPSLAGEKGDWGYELAASAGMFKSFVSSFTVNQYRALMATDSWRFMGIAPEARGAAAKLLRAIDMAAGATIMGAISLQVIEVLNGRDPQDMTNMEDPSFWSRAALKGGGFGLVGDLIAIERQQWGRALASWIVGPIPELVEDTASLTVGNLIEAGGNAYAMARGGEWTPTEFGSEAVKFVDDWTPNDFPVIGTVADRLIFDRLQMMLDPEGTADIARAARAAENRTGNEFWWTPGKSAPDRGPNLGAAFGQ